MKLTEKSIQEIEGIIGYTFKNKDLLSTAFRRKSFTEEQPNGGLIPNNETLEFYGDTALKMCVVKALAEKAVQAGFSDARKYICCRRLFYGTPGICRALYR